MSSFSSDDGRYRLMQANQTFFKSCIEFILAGNETKLQEVINDFYHTHKSSIGNNPLIVTHSLVITQSLTALFLCRQSARDIRVIPE